MSDNSGPFDVSSGKSADLTGSGRPSDPETAQSPDSGTTSPSYTQMPSARPPFPTNGQGNASSAASGSGAPQGSAPGSGYPHPPVDGSARSSGGFGSAPRPAGFGTPFPGGPYGQRNGPVPQQPWQGPGYPPNYGPGPYPQQPAWVPPSPYARWNGICIAGFVLSFFIAPLGLVLSIIALVQIHRTREKSRGMAIAGIVVSIVHMVLVVLLILGFIWALSAYSSGDSYSCVGSDCTPSWLDTDYGQTDEYAALRQLDGDPPTGTTTVVATPSATREHAEFCTAATFG